MLQSCPDLFNGTRCQNQYSSVENKQVEKSTLRRVIYGFSITLLICLIAIGAYYTLLKDYWLTTYIRNFFSRFSFRSDGSSTNRSVHFIRTNFNFNKLDDEQSITQNELNNI